MDPAKHKVLLACRPVPVLVLLHISHADVIFDLICPGHGLLH
jgi:hypothetical protein